METNHWYRMKGQSLATFASKAGFQLALYDNYSKSVQEELKRRAIKEALAEIYNASEEQGFDLWDIKKRGLRNLSFESAIDTLPEEALSSDLYRPWESFHPSQKPFQP